MGSGVAISRFIARPGCGSCEEMSDSRETFELPPARENQELGKVRPAIARSSAPTQPAHLNEASLKPFGQVPDGGAIGPPRQDLWNTLKGPSLGTESRRSFMTIYPRSRDAHCWASSDRPMPEAPDSTLLM